MKKLVLLAILLSGCGVMHHCQEKPITRVDPAFRTIYDLFYKELEDRNLKPKFDVASITWADKMSIDTDIPGGEVAGECMVWDNNAGWYYHVIHINRASPSELLPIVIIHEIGHCALGFCHSTDPDDIMAPIVPGQLTQERVDNFFNTYSRGETYTDCEYK